MAVPVFNLAPNLTVSRLCLGTMTFGEQNTLPQSFRLLDQAFHAGINFFDSAEMYPVVQRAETQGRSEQYLGRWIRKSNIPRDRVVLATKVTGPSGQMTWIRDGPKSLDARNITEAIDSSLRQLQTDYIDLYQIHWPDRYVPLFGEIEYDPSRQFCSIPIEEQLDALGRAVDSGKIRYVGLSNETPYGLMKFLQVAERGTCHAKIVSVQNSYSLLCRTFDSGLAECCHHERISLLAYSPLAMGILSGKYFLPDGGPSDARLNIFRGKYSEGESRYNLSNHSIRAASMEYIDIAEKYGLHPVSLAIAFVLSHPLVASVVFGATKVWQLQEVLHACKVELTPEVIVEINKVHKRTASVDPDDISDIALLVVNDAIALEKLLNNFVNPLVDPDGTILSEKASGVSARQACAIVEVKEQCNHGVSHTILTEACIDMLLSPHCMLYSFSLFLVAIKGTIFRISLNYWTIGTHDGDTNPLSAKQ